MRRRARAALKRGSVPPSSRDEGRAADRPGSRSPPLRRALHPGGPSRRRPRRAVSRTTAAYADRASAASGGDDEAGGSEGPRRMAVRTPLPAGGDDDTCFACRERPPSALANSLASCFQGLSAPGIRCYVDHGESTVDFVILGSIESRFGTARPSRRSEGRAQRALLGRLLLDAKPGRRRGQARRRPLGRPRPREAHAALQNQISRPAQGDRRPRRHEGAGVSRAHRARGSSTSIDSVSSSRTPVRRPTSAERSRLLREADAVFRGNAARRRRGAVRGRRVGRARRAEAGRGRSPGWMSISNVGRHAELVPELRSLIARQPLRERLRAQHIVALYRSGRQAESARGVIARPSGFSTRSSGLEPSPALRELEGAILRQEPELGGPSGAGS